MITLRLKAFTSVQNKTQNGRKATGQTTGETIFLPNMQALMFQYSLQIEDATCKTKVLHMLMTNLV